MGKYGGCPLLKILVLLDDKETRIRVNKIWVYSH